jgi:hypothetical protein
MNNNIIFTPPALISSPLELDYHQVKAICMDLFSGKATYVPLWQVYKFVKRCEGLSVCNFNNDIMKAKLFPLNLLRDAKDWVIKWYKNNSWSNLKSALSQNLGILKLLLVVRGSF